MEGYLKTEVAIANMPRVRVQPRSNKKYMQEDLLSGYPMSGTNKNAFNNGRNFANFMDSSTQRQHESTSIEYRKSERKPRLNYELLIAKAQKKVNGSDKEKSMRPKEFEPARPDHMFETDQVAIRRLYNEIVKK